MWAEPKVLVHAGMLPSAGEFVYLAHIEEEISELYAAGTAEWFLELGDLLMGVIKCTALYGPDKVVEYIWSLDNFSDSREKFEFRLSTWATLDRTSIITQAFYNTIYLCGLHGNLADRLKGKNSDAALRWLENNHLISMVNAKVGNSYARKKICDHGLPISARPDGWSLKKVELDKSKFEPDVDERILRSADVLTNRSPMDVMQEFAVEILMEHGAPSRQKARNILRETNDLQTAMVRLGIDKLIPGDDGYVDNRISDVI